MFSVVSSQVAEALRQIAGREAPEQIAELLYRSADSLLAEGVSALLLRTIALQIHRQLHSPIEQSPTFH